MTKRYPFNLNKHAHDLEFRRNRAMNIQGSLSMDDKEYARYQKLIDDLADILLYFHNGDGIIWLTGKEWALAKESVMWAEETRGALNAGRR